MKTVLSLIVVLFAVCTFGCGTVGQLEMSSGQVSVVTGDKIKADPRKREALLDDHGVELLHDYVLHYVKQNRIRNSLKLDITITSFRIAWGRDHMSTQTVLREHGKEIARYTSVSTTSRGRKVKRFTKDLAKQIVTKARRY